MWSQITIIDDDFMDLATEVVVFSEAAEAQAEVMAVIEIYSRRNLNVAKNLWLLHEYCNRQWGRWNERITHWQKHIPEYAPYHDDLLFYLTS